MSPICGCHSKLWWICLLLCREGKKYARQHCAAFTSEILAAACGYPAFRAARRILAGIQGPASWSLEEHFQADLRKVRANECWVAPQGRLCLPVGSGKRLHSCLGGLQLSWPPFFHRHYVLASHLDADAVHSKWHWCLSLLPPQGGVPEQVLCGSWVQILSVLLQAYHRWHCRRLKPVHWFFVSQTRPYFLIIGCSRVGYIQWYRMGHSPWKKISCTWKCPRPILSDNTDAASAGLAGSWAAYLHWCLCWVPGPQHLIRLAAQCLVKKKQCISFELNWLLIINLHVFCSTCLCGLFLYKENMFQLLFEAVVDHFTMINSLRRLLPFIAQTMQNCSWTDDIAGRQFSTCFTTRILLLSDLLQVLTMWDYRSLHTSSLNKSIGFELCKQKSAVVSTLAANLFLSMDLFHAGNLKWLLLCCAFQDGLLKQIV